MSEWNLPKSNLTNLRSDIPKQELNSSKELEVQQAKSQIPLRASKNGFEASLQQAKDKTKGESIDRLKSEIRGLKNENSVLRQQNDKMLGKLESLCLTKP